MKDIIGEAVNKANRAALEVNQDVTTAVTSNVQSTENIIVSDAVKKQAEVRAIAARAEAAADGALSRAQEAVTLKNDAISKAANEAAERAQFAANQATAIADKLSNKLASLPMDKDPDVLRRQAEAKMLRAKADAEEKILKLKENTVEQAKEKINSLKIPLPQIPKLPLIDPKILATVSMLKQAKEVMKQRKKLVKKALDDGRKLYRYDLKMVNSPTPTPTAEVESLPTF